MNPRIIGIDPSITATGIVDAAGNWSTVHATDRGDGRLRWIYNAVRDAAQEASLAVVEDLPVHAHSAGLLGMAQGVLRLALMRASVPYVLVPPATLKKYATGKGNADKPMMRAALRDRLGIDLRDDNQVDAFWLRAMGLDWMGDPMMQLPADQRAVLRKLAWPKQHALPEAA